MFPNRLRVYDLYGNLGVEVDVRNNCETYFVRIGPGVYEISVRFWIADDGIVGVKFVGFSEFRQCLKYFL